MLSCIVSQFFLPSPGIPDNGFKIGETWILLAHIKGGRRGVGVSEDQTTPVYYPAIFHAFKPARIEYIVTGLETTDELEAFEKRGFTLINVIRDIDTQRPIEFENK